MLDPEPGASDPGVFAGYDPGSFVPAAEPGPPGCCQSQGFGAALLATRWPAEIRRVPVARRLRATATPPCKPLPVRPQIHEAGVIPDPSGVYAATFFPSLSFLC